MEGIDVSENNGTINWQDVVNDGNEVLKNHYGGIW